MGNEQSLRNLSKRESRREHQEDFAAAISKFLHRDDVKKFATRTSELPPPHTSVTRVVVRKRPIFKNEVENREFDAITCWGTHCVALHDGRLQSDMKNRFIRHHMYRVHRTFGENDSNELVFTEEVQALVDATLNGEYSTCLMYGQTGSGKTYTMSAMYESAARHIFANKDPSTRVELTMYELSGDSARDLLSEQLSSVQLLTAKDGTVHATSLIHQGVPSASAMIACIRDGITRRHSAATGSNATSSRSHAILTVTLTPAGSSASADLPQCGTLVLVDLAGSENKVDSLYHNAERRQEGAVINQSLMALKDCIRARACGQDAAHCYRQSKLTMALKGSFSDRARTTVIVTVSPKSADTEQSMNSLRHASLMLTSAQSQRRGSDKGGKTSREPVEECGDVVVEELGIHITEAMKAKKEAEKQAQAVFTCINDVTDSDACKENKLAIARIEKQLEDKTLSGITRGGLKKRLAVHKAAVLKETRKQQDGQKISTETIAASAGHL